MALKDNNKSFYYMLINFRVKYDKFDTGDKSSDQH
jgi:hypothetical protein